LDCDEKTAISRLWSRELVPDLFPIDQCDVVYLHSWINAVPVVHVNHYREIKEYREKIAKLPLVFAGDWLGEVCVEGAVRSGIFAASLFQKK